MSQISRMSTESPAHPRRNGWRLALLLLVAVPLLPEIVIWIVAALARLKGCHPGDASVCLIGSVPAGDVIHLALETSAGLIVRNAQHSLAWQFGFYAAVACWIALCFLVVMRGWARVSSRLLLGFAVIVVVGVLPYFAPQLAIANLIGIHCDPNAGASHQRPCTIFGGPIGDAADATVIMAASASIARRIIGSSPGSLFMHRIPPYRRLPHLRSSPYRCGGYNRVGSPAVPPPGPLSSR